MPRLVWDQVGERLYETGVEKGVVYPLDDAGAYSKGAAWNGLTAVNEAPSGAEATPLYANNKKYLNLMSAEDFGGTIEAYTFPDEFAACNGYIDLAAGVQLTQQTRRTFGLTYRSAIGNDIVGTDYGYKIHLVYGATASPSEKNNATINESPEAATLSWEFTTTPVDVEGFKPTSHIVIDSTKVNAEQLKALEDILYGSDEGEARLPLPAELATIFVATGA